jgi:hypothetical protein
MENTFRMTMLGKDVYVDLSNDNVITESTIKSVFLLPPDAVVSLFYKVDSGRIGCR